MNKKALDVHRALLQLQKDVLSYSTASLTEEYGMPFLKSESSTFPCVITSGDLAFSLNEKLGIDITLAELNDLLPEICPPLGISLEPMASLDDLSNSSPFRYMITLSDK